MSKIWAKLFQNFHCNMYIIKTPICLFYRVKCCLEPSQVYIISDCLICHQMIIIFASMTLLWLSFIMHSVTRWICLFQEDPAAKWGSRLGGVSRTRLWVLFRRWLGVQTPDRWPETQPTQRWNRCNFYFITKERLAFYSASKGRVTF